MPTINQPYVCYSSSINNQAQSFNPRHCPRSKTNTNSKGSSNVPFGFRNRTRTRRRRTAPQQRSRKSHAWKWGIRHPKLKKRKSVVGVREAIWGSDCECSGNKESKCCCCWRLVIWEGETLLLSNYASSSKPWRRVLRTQTNRREGGNRFSHCQVMKWYDDGVDLRDWDLSLFRRLFAGKWNV